MQFAKNTEVSPDRSRSEIEKTLGRYGAQEFLYAWRETSLCVGFTMNGYKVRFIVNIPDETEFTKTDTGRDRSITKAREFRQQAIKQRWRALALGIKAKLELVESGIVTFEKEFLPNILLPNHQTVADYIMPQVQKSYDSGSMPPLLPWGGDSDDQMSAQEMPAASNIS